MVKQFAQSYIVFFEQGYGFDSFPNRGVRGVLRREFAKALTFESREPCSCNYHCNFVEASKSKLENKLSNFDFVASTTAFVISKINSSIKQEAASLLAMMQLHS